MTRHLVGRLGQAILVLWAAYTVAFVLLQALPGDALLIKFQNPDMGLSAEQIADIRASYSADDPMLLRYAHSIGHTLRGDFGYSVQDGVPVAELLRTALPATARLAGLGFLLAAALAAGVAALSSLAPRWLRGAARALPSLFVSLPTFWLGIVLIQVVSFRLKLIPVISPGFWQGLVLPVVTVAVPISAPLAQILIRSMDDALAQPYVAVARAKGASRGRALWRYVVPNAILPPLTIAGILLGELVAGAVITETVFGLNGLGTLTQQAVANQDTSVLQAVVVLAACGFVAINLVVDLLYPVLDPRLARRRVAA